MVAQMAQRKKRQWNSEQYPHAFLVRVSVEEHRQIKELAEMARMSASRYLVACSTRRQSPRLRQPPPKTVEEREQLERLLTELHHIGSNLNQLARGYNYAKIFGSKAPSRAEVEEAALAAKELIQEIRERL